MGKSTVVAERHRKLARHDVPGKASDKAMCPERTLETVPFPAFPPSLAGRIFFGTQPGTLSLANFQGRFATARMLKIGLSTINVEEPEMNEPPYVGCYKTKW
jgi:hypothetical protein